MLSQRGKPQSIKLDDGFPICTFLTLSMVKHDNTKTLEWDLHTLQW